MLKVIKAEEWVQIIVTNLAGADIISHYCRGTSTNLFVISHLKGCLGDFCWSAILSFLHPILAGEHPLRRELGLLVLWLKGFYHVTSACAWPAGTSCSRFCRTTDRNKAYISNVRILITIGKKNQSHLLRVYIGGDLLDILVPSSVVIVVAQDGEALPAVLALVRFLPGMPAHVHFHVELFRKQAMAHWTGEATHGSWSWWFNRWIHC